MRIKYTLLTIFICFNFAIIRGQNVKGGFLAGLNATQVAGDVASGYNKAGIVFGIFANTDVSENAEFQMEMMYIQKGSRMNPSEENAYDSYLLRVNYIDLPFLYRYHFSDQILFEVGLAYGYLIHHYEEADLSTSVSATSFNNHALNVLAGLEYRFSDDFSFNFRSSNSIIPVRGHSSGVKRLFNSGQYNDVLSFTLRYQFSNDK
ncbi:MAG: outer membrane beta-barrel protein [Bacteroidales bacterium]|jgi:hypothetical protein|nr:outer membrane beta-barrel protein [Bacteroidales bacterium]